MQRSRSLIRHTKAITISIFASVIAAGSIVPLVRADNLALTYIGSETSPQTVAGYPSNPRHFTVDGGLLTAVGNDGKVYTQEGIVPHLDNVAKAYTGKTSHTPIAGFAIKTDGTLWSWGRGVQLGRVYDPNNTGTNQDDVTPRQITGLPHIQDIQIGNNHVLALDISGNVWSWGDNTAEQLGTDTACPNPSPVVLGPECTTTPRILPAQVPGLSNIKSISAGQTSSLGLTQNGTVMFWGSLCRVESNHPHYPTPTPYPGIGTVKQALTDDCSMTYLTHDSKVFTQGFQGKAQGPFVQVQNLPEIESTPIESISSDGYNTRAARYSDGHVFGYQQVYFNNQPATAFFISSIDPAVPHAAYHPTYFEGNNNTGGIVTLTNTVSPDTTPPELSTWSWSQNPKPISATTTLSIPVSDSASIIEGGEYFIGNNDPGLGNGTAMQLADISNDGLHANLTTTFGSDFPTGVYEINVRAQDSAGNWTTAVSDYLVVYNPDGPKMTGKRAVIPSTINGDTLPGLIAANQTDKAKFGFSVKYNNQGQISSNSDFMFSYTTGTHCNKPAEAVNCHTVSIDATTIAWLTTQGTNNSTGIFQGTATMTIDEQSSTVLLKITGIDGERLSPTATDQFQLHIFAEHADPATDQPLYQINATDIARGNIKITDI